METPETEQALPDCGVWLRASNEGRESPQPPWYDVTPEVMRNSMMSISASLDVTSFLLLSFYLLPRKGEGHPPRPLSESEAELRLKPECSRASCRPESVKVPCRVGE